MSRHHSTQAYRVQDLVKQVDSTPVEDWPSLFFIEALEDGSVEDTVYGKVFDTILEWATFNVELEFDDVLDRQYGMSED